MPILHADDYFYLALSVTNIAMGVLMAYSQLRFYKGYRGLGLSWIWVKLGLGLLGIYWAALYVLVILQTLLIIPPSNPIWFGRIFVRPALTITFAMIAAGGLMRWGRNGSNGGKQ